MPMSGYSRRRRLHSIVQRPSNRESRGNRCDQRSHLAGMRRWAIAFPERVQGVGGLVACPLDTPADKKPTQAQGNVCGLCEK